MFAFLRYVGQAPGLVLFTAYLLQVILEWSKTRCNEEEVCDVDNKGIGWILGYIEWRAEKKKTEGKKGRLKKSALQKNKGAFKKKKKGGWRAEKKKDAYKEKRVRQTPKKKKKT